MRDSGIGSEKANLGVRSFATFKKSVFVDTTQMFIAGHVEEQVAPQHVRIGRIKFQENTLFCSMLETPEVST